jgi:2-oxoisovalerate dehydrogenase E2 component (dihydrolipoyl transacylase)
MIRSATQIPQAWTMMEVDVTNLVNLREKFRLEFKRTHGVNLTYMPFTLQAVAASLKDHPGVNSSWGNNSIILKHRINIGVAVASDAGLVVPVIHDTDLLDVAGLAVAVDDLARRVRDGKLSLSDVQDSTFTINNTGVFGSVIGKPLINPPEAAIMNTEAVIKRPVVIDDEIVVRSIMNLCLTFDHRVLDGAEAGAFLKSVKSRLESIDSDNIV